MKLCGQQAWLSRIGATVRPIFMLQTEANDTERWMRQGLMFVAVVIGGGLSLGVSSHDAKSALLPAVSSPAVVSSLVVEAGWRRNWRRYGPTVVIPNADVDVDDDVDEEVTVPGETPPLIAIVPVRPVSCGEFRYWDGERCVDARYHNPYIGPR
jgi:hypothetical protein